MRLFVPVLVSLIGLGCAAAPATVDLGGKQFKVTIADTPNARQLGLMYVKDLPADEGMLFIFKEERARSFWMKNTLIALDILYFGADRKLVSAQLNAQPCRADPCRSYPSTGPAKYVLELAAGVGRDLRLKPGDEIVINR